MFQINKIKMARFSVRGATSKFKGLFSNLTGLVVLVVIVLAALKFRPQIKEAIAKIPGGVGDTVNKIVG